MGSDVRRVAERVVGHRLDAEAGLSGNGRDVSTREKRCRRLDKHRVHYLKVCVVAPLELVKRFQHSL
jgi:hypothetical protein